MKYLDEFSDPELARKLVDQIKRATSQRWSIMEVCGGQTHSIIRHGIDQLLPETIEMIHGPGCPVCVTPLEIIDKALEIASRPDVIFCSFGDMLRVPGSDKDLFRVKSEGGDVRVVYSPLDALNIAKDNPDKQVVFFGIGFETTAPANAMTVYQAKRLGIENFSLLVSHVLVPPAIAAIMESPTCRVQAFLAAGHVCTVMGTDEYPPLCDKYGIPIVVTGFEPLDILEGIRRTVLQLESGRHELENAYPRAVQDRGQPGRQGHAAGRVRGDRPGVARHRRDPEQRLAVVVRLPRLRRRAPVRRHRHPHRGVGGVPVRRGTAGLDQTARVRSVRDTVHAAQSAWRDDGLVRGRMRGVLPVPAARGDAMPETTALRPATIDMESWVCPAPLRDAPNIVMGHGGGGAMSAELIEHLFLPAFGPAADAGMGDSAVVDIGGARLAFSTDSFVVKPLVFPGGTIGDLAVNGTVNDLAMAGARPMVLSTAFILEEGTALDEIARVAHAVGTAAMAAGVKLVTGDTKVVDSGHGDGVYINTAGIGLVDERADIRPQRASPGDVVIVSGDIGVHGVAVMSCREGLEFATTIASDTRAAARAGRGDARHRRRHPRAARPDQGRRGGDAERDREEPRKSVSRLTSGPCRFLLRSAMRAVCSASTRCMSPTRASWSRSCPPRTPTGCWPRCSAHPQGGRAAVIGECVTDHPGMVSARTALGGTRVVDLPIGEQLPRIC